MWLFYWLFFIFIPCHSNWVKLKVLQNYCILFNQINNYYKAFSVLVFDQAHPEFSVSAHNLFQCIPTIYCNYFQSTVFATTCSFKGSHTHTHTHTPVCNETFKRCVNVVCMNSFCSTLASCPHIFCLTKATKPSKKTVKAYVMLELFLLLLFWFMS